MEYYSRIGLIKSFLRVSHFFPFNKTNPLVLFKTTIQTDRLMLLTSLLHNFSDSGYSVNENISDFKKDLSDKVVLQLSVGR